jgi:tetratricopeptide (TPR) repeat protein
MKSPGRNDPCPCGSRKKYKKCCLSREQAQRSRAAAAEKPWIAELRPELDEAVDRVLQRLERGEGKAVEPEIAELLENHPDYHMTHYAMGVYLATVTKDAAAAIPFFEKAVAIFPPFAEGHFNLAMAARQTLNVPKSVEAFLAAKRYAQDDWLADKARDEIKCLESILLKDTSFPNLDAYVANARLYDRAFECLNQRQFAEAAELFQSVLKKQPRHVQSHGNLALAYAGLGRRADALACFDRALELDPGYEPALMNRCIIAQMREGEPFLPDAIASVEYYADKVRAEQRPG